MKKFINIFFLLISISGIASTNSINKKNIDKAEEYLNSINGLQGTFVQTNNGKNLQGIFSILRPGKLKLEYKNSKMQLIADGNDLYFIDDSIEQITTIPLKTTPAEILLRKSINLQSADIKVIETKEEKNLFSLSMQLKDQEGLGILKLIFTKNPVNLYAWNITDALGNNTYIKFDSLYQKTDFPKNFFQIKKHITINNNDGDNYYE